MSFFGFLRWSPSRGVRWVVGAQAVCLGFVGLVALGSWTLAPDAGAAQAVGAAAPRDGVDRVADEPLPLAATPRPVSPPPAVTLASLPSPAAEPTLRDRVGRLVDELRGNSASDEATGSATLRYPIVGPSNLTRSFGDPRGRNRRHAGVDIMAAKLLPVLAVADGTVTWVRTNQASAGVMVSLRHDDGWSSRYMHLNNDLPGSDDGAGFGVAPGIEDGARVRAGDLLGYVGDSGNAESTAPHLHFELHDPDGTAVDPYPWLHAAQEPARGAGDGSATAAGG